MLTTKTFALNHQRLSQPRHVTVISVAKTENEYIYSWLCSFRTNLFDVDYKYGLVLSLQVCLTLIAEKIWPPEDSVDILPAIKVLSKLNESRELSDTVHDNVIQYKKIIRQQNNIWQSSQN